MVADGRLYTRDALDAARARWRAYVHDPFVERVGMWLARAAVIGGGP